MASEITANDLLNRLAARYSSDEGWVMAHEVGDACGHRTRRHIDAMAINLWPSKKAAISFEVKVSRADFMNELAQPEKRAAFEEAGNEFWFVCAKGVVKDLSEVPEGLGLLEERGKGLVRKRAATFHRGRELSAELHRAFIKALDRRHNATMAALSGNEFAELHGREVSLKDLRRLGGKYADHDLRVENWSLSQRVEDLERRRGARREWWRKWNEAVKSIRSALGLRYNAGPEEIQAAVAQVGAVRSIEKAAEGLRRLADELEGAAR
jgi:hypothetical protein